MGEWDEERAVLLAEIAALRTRARVAEEGLALLREVEERYRLITKASGDLVSETDARGRFTYAASCTGNDCDLAI